MSRPIMVWEFLSKFFLSRALVIFFAVFFFKSENTPVSFILQIFLLKGTCTFYKKNWQLLWVLSFINQELFSYIINPLTIFKYNYF